MPRVQQFSKLSSVGVLKLCCTMPSGRMLLSTTNLQRGRYRACIRCMAGCATSTRAASYAGATASAKLTLRPDPSMRAAQLPLVIQSPRQAGCACQHPSDAAFFDSILRAATSPRAGRNATGGKVGRRLCRALSILAQARGIRGLIYSVGCLFHARLRGDWNCACGRANTRAPPHRRNVQSRRAGLTARPNLRRAIRTS